MSEKTLTRGAIEEHVIRALYHVLTVTKSRMAYDFDAATEHDKHALTAKTPDAEALAAHAIGLTKIYAQNTGHDVADTMEMSHRALHVALRANGLIPKR